MERCPLITSYATNSNLSTTERPFTSIDAGLLEKLYLIRKWDIDAEKHPVPFKHPTQLRKTIWDTDNEIDSGIPLIVKEFQKQAIIHLARMPRFFFLVRPSD